MNKIATKNLNEPFGRRKVMQMKVIMVSKTNLDELTEDENLKITATKTFLGLTSAELKTNLVKKFRNEFGVNTSNEINWNDWHDAESCLEFFARLSNHISPIMEIPNSINEMKNRVAKILMITPMETFVKFSILEMTQIHEVNKHNLVDSSQEVYNFTENALGLIKELTVIRMVEFLMENDQDNFIKGIYIII